MPPHCSALTPSLHHLPTSFIPSTRHWEHSTTHLPPVNIAWRLNYTHTHSQTRVQSQRNFLQRWSRESTSNLWGIHSSERECVCVWVMFTCVCVFVCVFWWPCIHYYRVTFVARGLVWWTVNTLGSYHHSYNTWPPINILFECFNKPIMDCLTTNVPFCLFFCLLTDDERQWGSLRGQLHQKGRTIHIYK